MRISDWSSDVCSSDLLPLALAGFALAELAPVALEGVVQQVRRQPALLAGGRQRDGGRGRVEVAKLGSTGDEVDAVRPCRHTDRRIEILAELVARRGHAPRLVVLDEELRDFQRVLVSSP